MSDETKNTIERAATVVGLLAALTAFLGAWFVLPYRMTAAESAIREVKSQSERDHDLIQRIDERTARMEKAIDKLTK